MRHVMFQAALVAAHHNPSLKSFADRLRKSGKPQKVIITAVVKELVTIANALFIKPSELGSDHDLTDTVANCSWFR